MNYIDLDFIPFKINKKFSKAKQEIDCSKKIKIFDTYSVTITIFRNCFNKTNIMFTLDENIDEIDDLLICKYGEPKYITSSGLRTWEVNGVYIVYGKEEYQYQCIRHTLSISLFKPGFTIDSDRYIRINKLFDKIAYNWKLKKSGVASVGITGEIHGIFENNNYQYLIIVEKKYLRVYSSKMIKEGMTIRQIPSWNQRTKYEKIEQLFSLINSYFIYVMDEDQELENTRYIDVEVKFYSSARDSFPNLNGEYRPHFSIDKGDISTYVGIEFIESDLNEFDVFGKATIKFLYPGIDYSSLKPGVLFKIYEGSTVVGEGKIY